MRREGCLEDTLAIFGSLFFLKRACRSSGSGRGLDNYNYDRHVISIITVVNQRAMGDRRRSSGRRVMTKIKVKIRARYRRFVRHRRKPRRERLAKAGYEVYGHHSRRGAQAGKRSFEMLAPRNVTSDESVEAAVSEVGCGATVRIDLLVNNAGFGVCPCRSRKRSSLDQGPGRSSKRTSSGLSG